MIEKVVVRCHVGDTRVQVGLAFRAAQWLPDQCGGLASEGSLFLKSPREDGSNEPEC